MREDGELAVDDDGMELRDIGAVQEEAARSLADMARDAVRRNGSVGYDLAIEVRDAAGPVLEVKFTFAISRRKH
jgi:orotidine-5'-phosphate decarboxylase